MCGDTDLTADAGKTSTSRQSFVSGMAVQGAGADLRRRILRLANAGPEAELALDGATLSVRDAGVTHRIDLAAASSLMGEGTFDPPTTPFGGAAQMAMIEVDTGHTENLHDYPIPTVGDVPEIECILIEDREPLGPSGTKGVLPHRLREAILARGKCA